MKLFPAASQVSYKSFLWKIQYIFFCYLKSATHRVFFLTVHFSAPELFFLKHSDLPYWPAGGYEPGHGQPSFDKQFARDWLKANPDNDWTLPQEIVDKTIEKYLQAYKMLTGKELA